MWSVPDEWTSSSASEKKTSAVPPALIFYLVGGSLYLFIHLTARNAFLKISLVWRTQRISDSLILAGPNEGPNIHDSTSAAVFPTGEFPGTSFLSVRLREGRRRG